MNLQRKIAIASILLGGLITVAALGSWMFYKSFVAPYFSGPEPPPELKEARVIVGTEFLVRSDFYRAGSNSSWLDFRDPDKLKNNLDSIVDVAVGQLDGRPGLDIGLVGKFGMTLLDTHGNLTKRITYQFAMGKIKVGPFEAEREKDSFSKLRAVDIESDGVCEILGYDGLDGATVFDHEGRVLFSRGEYAEGKSSIQEVAAGDIDGDGVLEFVAGWGYESWSGIELFDRYGNSKWKLQEDFTPGPFEIVDLDRDGKAEIVEEDGGTIKVRDVHGKVVSSAEMPVYLWHLSLCPRPGPSGQVQNLAVREGSLWLINLDGKNSVKFDAPLSLIKLKMPRRVPRMPGMSNTLEVDSEEVFRAKGVWFKVKTEQPEVLGIVARFGSIDRSLFYVYDQQGKLLYHEILPEECHAIAVLRSEDDGGVDNVLVAGETTVWRYSAR